MAWRSERTGHHPYSSPNSKGYKAVMADLTAFLAAFTNAFEEFETKEGVVKQRSVRVVMGRSKTNGNQMVLKEARDEDESSIQCLLLNMPSLPQGQDTVLVEDALGLVELALRTIPSKI